MTELTDARRTTGPPQTRRPGPPDPGHAAPNRWGGPGSLFGAGYLGFVVAMALSSLGDAAWAIALAWSVADSTGPATAGAVLALGTLPRLVTLLGGGALADSAGPVRVMVRTDLARSAVMVAAALAVAATGPTLPVLVGAAMALSIFSALFTPASGALRPQLLPAEHLVRGNALYLIGLRGGQAAGGPIGGWLVGLGGVPLVAGVNAVTFLVSALAVRRVRPLSGPAGSSPPAGPPGGAAPTGTPAVPAPTGTPAVPAAAPTSGPTRMLGRIADGFRYVARDRRLALLLIVVGLSEVSASGPLNIGVVLLADAAGTSVGGAGLLLTAFTLGATASFLATLVRPVRRHAVAVVAPGMAVQAACLAGLGLLPSVRWGLAAYFLLGLVTGLTGVVLVSLVQRWSAAEVRGRVMSIQALLIFGAVPLGNLVVGVMIQYLGVTATMVTHGLLAVAAVTVYLSVPTLRRARLD